MAHIHVILTESLRGVGRVGEVVRVAAGYARNYLIPRGYAEHATEANRRRLNGQLRAKKVAEAKQFDEAAALAAEIEGLELQVVRSAGDSGRLFGSVTTSDVAEALSERGYPFTRRQVILPQPIREIGSYEVELQLHPQVSVPLPLTVLSTSNLRGDEEAEAETAEETAENEPAEEAAEKTAEGSEASEA